MILIERIDSANLLLGYAEGDCNVVKLWRTARFHWQNVNHTVILKPTICFCHIVWLGGTSQKSPSIYQSIYTFGNSRGRVRFGSHMDMKPARALYEQPILFIVESCCNNLISWLLVLYVALYNCILLLTHCSIAVRIPCVRDPNELKQLISANKKLQQLLFCSMRYSFSKYIRG